MYYKMSDLLNLALASPKIGMINCFMLHTLLHAIIKRLDIGETRVKVPEKPDEVMIPFQKEPVVKEVKTEEAEVQKTSHEVITDIQGETQPEIPAIQIDETEATDSLKITEKYSSTQIVSEAKKESETELSITAVPKLTISGESSKEELKKDLDNEPSETEFKMTKPPESIIDYPSRHFSIDATSDKIIGGIPYAESLLNDLYTRLSYFPSVDGMEKLFELLQNHSLSKDENAEDIINAKVKFLKNLEGILDKVHLMDVRLKKFESITFVYNIDEIINKLHSLDIKLEELQNTSLLRNIGDIMNKIQSLTEKQEETTHKLEKAEEDITILEVFMKHLEVTESEKKKQKDEKGGSMVQFDQASPSKSVISIDFQHQATHEHKFHNRLSQTENELSDIKSYLFKKRKPSQVSFQASLTPPYAQTPTPQGFTTEEQWEELNKHMEKFVRRTSMSAAQNIYNLTEQIETLHENIKNLSINVKSLETAKGFLEHNVQQLWKEIKHIQEMLTEDSDILNRLSVAERKLDLKLEIMEENINLMNADNKRLKNAISNIELEKFSKSNVALNDQGASKSKGITALTPNEMHEVTKELEKRIEEQKTYFTNQLWYFNELLSSKSERWELEWLRVWLEKSLKTQLRNRDKSRDFDLEEAIAVKRKLVPDKCLSCNKPLTRKQYQELPEKHPMCPQILKGNQCLELKNPERSPGSSSLTSNIDRKHLIHPVGKYWGKRRKTIVNSKATHHAIWLEGRDGRLYRGSEDDSLNVEDTPFISIKEDPNTEENEQGETTFVPPNIVSKKLSRDKSSLSTHSIKETILLPEDSQVYVIIKRAQSLSNITELIENSHIKPGKASIYASTSQIESIQKLIADNFKDTISDKKEEGIGKT